MFAYTTRRVLLVIPTMLLVTMIVFLMVRLIPGNVVDLMLDEIYGLGTGASGGAASVGASGATIDRAEIERRLGLDVPIHIQYGRWLGVVPIPDEQTGESAYNGIFQGNLGISLRTHRNMTEEIVSRFPVTFELGLLAVLTANLIAIPVGIYSAIRQDTWLDYLGRSFSILSLATPAFWLATILIVYGARYLNWSPAVEYVPFSEDPIENLKILIIPALLVGTAMSGGVMRFLRTIMLEVLRQDYVRTAWAKGLKEKVIILRHALRNALIPLVTIFAPQVGILIGGSVIMERIFVLPGMGQYMLRTLLERDYWVVSGTNLIFAVFTMLLVLVTDLSYAYLDPRIRYK
jgi:peptide/nickel transport system permease protein